MGSVIEKFEDRQKLYVKQGVLSETHLQEFKESLPTSKRFLGRIELTREHMLGDEIEFNMYLEFEIHCMKTDIKQLREYMLAKGYRI